MTTTTTVECSYCRGPRQVNAWCTCSGATAAYVADVIRNRSFTFANEDQLQGALAEVLTGAGFEVRREVHIDVFSRLDLVVDRVGIEVKIKGSATKLARQLQRYAQCPDIDALVLVTHSAEHGRFLPDRILGKPLHVAWIGGAL